MDEVACKAIRDLKIGDFSLGSDALLQSKKQMFKRSCYKKQDENYLAGMYTAGVQ